MQDRVLLKNALLYRGGRFEAGCVLVEDGRIAAVGDIPQNAAGLELDLAGHKLVPGFLDIHTHGGAGVDVNDASPEGLSRLSAFYASHGTTGWLASVLTDTREQTLRSIAQLCALRGRQPEGAALLGIHLEGPFLAREYKGAMPERLLREGDVALFDEYQQAAGGWVRYITVSPEVPGVPGLVEKISGQVVVAMGHSGADYETAMDCVKKGVAAATHTFNAMGLFHQHRPAIMGAALESDIYCEAICDGRHLHPGSVRLLLKCKGWDRVVAITDSIQAAGLPDGKYKLGVNDVVVEDGDAKLADTGVRAGSTLTQDTALRNLMAFTGEPMEKVLPLLTENPARLLGIDKAKGRIEPGFDADFAVIDDNARVYRTIVGGRTVYTA